jgi:short-subunit dehydrogenase
MRRLTSYRGLTALVTGASSGIGRLLALRLAREGARVGLVARRARELERAAQEIRAGGGDARVLACDVADREQVDACAASALDHFGGIDILVNNAGYGHHRSFLEWDVADMERMLRVNFLGTLYFTKALLPQMVERRKGWLVFIASVAGRIAPDAGVHVMTVCPGAIRTPFFDEEALRRMPPVARRSMVAPEGLVDAIVRGLAKGARELTHPRSIAAGYVVRAVAPGFMRRQVRRFTLDAIEKSARESRTD